MNGRWTYADGQMQNRDLSCSTECFLHICLDIYFSGMGERDVHFSRFYSSIESTYRTMRHLKDTTFAVFRSTIWRQMTHRRWLPIHFLSNSVLTSHSFIHKPIWWLGTQAHNHLHPAASLPNGPHQINLANLETSQTNRNAMNALSSSRTQGNQSIKVKKVC